MAIRTWLICLAWPAILSVPTSIAAADPQDKATASDAGLSAGELEQLVAPIALYPDPLIAQILPAATFPTDVVLAARWLRTKPDMDELEDKPWDDSIVALCHYPDVLYKMDEDLDWTNALGAAFLGQPQDVMAAIQQARARAEALGMLKTNEQQTVVVEQNVIRILPTQTNVVYVPQYDPQVVYVKSGVGTGTVVAASAISFGVGFAMGAWLNLDCSWHHYHVYYCRPGYWPGWAHYGSVTWGAGPRRAFAVGENRGYYVGPRGGAAWGPNGGAVWRRPPGATPLPVYSGRYAGYNTHYGSQYYRGGGNYSNNQFTRNQVNNINIDRGDRTTIAGGDRTAVGRGDRTGTDRDQGRLARGNQAQQLPADASRRPAGTPRTGDRGGAFDMSAGRRQAGDYGARGQQSRVGMHQGGTGARSSAGTRASPGGSLSPPRQSAFSSGQSARQTRQYSQRGAASRGGARGGRGGRRGR